MIDTRPAAKPLLDGGQPVGERLDDGVEIRRDRGPLDRTAASYRFSHLGEAPLQRDHDIGIGLPAAAVDLVTERMDVARQPSDGILGGDLRGEAMKGAD